jgi:hypothetical protein
VAPRQCGGFKPGAVVAIPGVVSEPFVAPWLRASVDAEACGRKPVAPRSTLVHFRGTLGAAETSQSLRARLPLLRCETRA